jgi:hypothetical protein
VSVHSESGAAVVLKRWNNQADLPVGRLGAPSADTPSQRVRSRGCLVLIARVSPHRYI